MYAKTSGWTGQVRVLRSCTGGGVRFSCDRGFQQAPEFRGVLCTMHVGRMNFRRAVWMITTRAVFVQGVLVNATIRQTQGSLQGVQVERYRGHGVEMLELRPFRIDALLKRDMNRCLARGFFVVTQQGHSLLSAHLLFMVAVRLLCRSLRSRGVQRARVALTEKQLQHLMQNALAIGVRAAVGRAQQANLAQHGVRPWTEQTRT